MGRLKEETMVEILPTAGLVAILIVVLAGPFLVRRIEQNLEAFLFACGVAALTIAGFVSIEGVATGWSPGIVLDALTAPVLIGRVFGIPVGIVQIVLVVGFLIYLGHQPPGEGHPAGRGFRPLGTLSFLLVVILGLLSSVISAILAVYLVRCPDTQESGPVFCRVERDTPAEVALRAARVYLFIMALVFLGEGFKPLILRVRGRDPG